jgi:hypothetical protein
VRHLVCIRSSYDEGHISEDRLWVTERVTVPSLRAQTSKDFELAVVVNEADPLLKLRKAAYESVGVPVTYVMRSLAMSHTDATGLPQGIPVGAKEDLQTRLDDDDALAVSFVERLRFRAQRGPRGVYTFPWGYVADADRVALRKYRDNQFLTRRGGPIFELTHNAMAQRGPLFVVDTQPAWLWVRHDTALSYTRAGRTYEAEKWLPINDVRDLFVIDWDALPQCAYDRTTERRS